MERDLESRSDQVSVPMQAYLSLSPNNDLLLSNPPSGQGWPGEQARQDERADACLPPFSPKQRVIPFRGLTHMPVKGSLESKHGKMSVLMHAYLLLPPNNA
eukprot:256694-Chlamydomonas_euryale.AAC.1